MRVVAAIRVLIKAVRNALIQRADFLGRFGESFTDRELFGHYGFASHPLPGAEGVTVFINGDINNAIVIATEDRRYRLTLREGEACLYTDEGDFVHLKRGKELHLKSGNKVLIEAPAVEVVGDLNVSGRITATGDIVDGGQNTNHHSHP
jgi:phage gp45-like